MDGIPLWCFVGTLLLVGFLIWIVWPLKGKDHD